MSSKFNKITAMNKISEVEEYFNELNDALLGALLGAIVLFLTLRMKSTVAEKRAKRIYKRAINRFLDAGAPVWKPAVEKFPNATAWAAVAQILGIESRFLSWDAAKLYGLHRDGTWSCAVTPQRVERAWMLSGCKNNNKFSYIIKRLSYGGRTDWIRTLNKGDSLNDCKNKVKFCGWAYNAQTLLETSRDKYWEFYAGKEIMFRKIHSGQDTGQDIILAGKTAIALARISPWARYVLLRELIARDAATLPRVVRIRDLDWGKVAAMRGNYAAKLAELSAHEQWTYATGITPSQKIDEGALPSWRGISKKKALALAALSPREYVGKKEIFPAFLQALRFFSSESEMTNLFNKYRTAIAVLFAELEQDVGQHCNMLHDFLNLGWAHSEHWKRLMLRSPRFDEHVWANIHSIEKYCAKTGAELPSSLAKANELLERAMIEGCVNYALNPKFAKTCAQYKLGEATFDQYVQFSQDYPAKKVDLIPDINMTVGDYTVRTLEIGDLTGPLLGVITNCCQHLDSAGRSCAKHGWSQENSRFLVVEKGSMIVAQSWIWLSRDGGQLCLDSIEAKSFFAELPRIIRELAAYLRDRDFTLYVGDTGYGVTRQVLHRLAHRAAKIRILKNPPSYMDGNSQILVLLDGDQ